MKVLFIQPLKAPKTVEIDGSLESMQKLVGGYIESIYPFEDGEICLVCNEEGKIEGLPLNRALYDTEGEIYDVIAGSFFVCSAPSDSESFASIEDEKLPFLMKRFGAIEYYL